MLAPTIGQIAAKLGRGSYDARMPPAPAPYLPVEWIDSRLAAWRLVVILLLMTLGSGGMYVVAVVLPQVQQEFGIGRGDASLPYTLLMIGFGIGGMVMGRLADRVGLQRVLLLGALGVGSGFVLASMAQGVVAFSLVHGLLLGLVGSSTTFAPLLADTALWWRKYRGVAVAVCASGNYAAGTVWPQAMSWAMQEWGWRQAYVVLGLGAALLMALLAWPLRRPAPPATRTTAAAQPAGAPASEVGYLGPDARPFGMSPARAEKVLWLAGLSCCVAMAMPQVHIVAYCTDLGFGAARGADLLSLMLFTGIVSRLVFGMICDRIGGLRTLLLGSATQALALVLFLPFQGPVSLTVVAGLFGLFQGGIVPSYAIVVREHFPTAQIGQRVGSVIMATLFGMALGGWMSGQVFDLTGSYRAAFVNGLAWNVLNFGLAAWLLWRVSGRPAWWRFGSKWRA